MPKNQFQRPLPIKQTGNVPRHGKNNPPLPKPVPTLRKAPLGPLPPLADLLAQSSGKTA